MCSDDRDNGDEDDGDDDGNGEMLFDHTMMTRWRTET